MTIDFTIGQLFAYNKGCVLITAVTLIALRDRWTSWTKAGVYAVGAYVTGSYAVHMAKADPWRPGAISGLTRPLKPAGFYGDRAAPASGGGETTAATTASGGGATGSSRASVVRM